MFTIWILVLVCWSIKPSIGNTYILTLACVTSGGEVPNKQCKFPWINSDNNKTYVGCANPNNDSKGYWCPTEVNEDGEFVPESGNWGYCSDKCQKDKGELGCQHQLLFQYTLMPAR